MSNQKKLGRDHYCPGGGGGGGEGGYEKVFSANIFFYAPLQTFFFEQHLPGNNFFPTFFNHVLTQKGGSLLLPSIII